MFAPASYRGAQTTPFDLMQSYALNDEQPNFRSKSFSAMALKPY